MTENEKIKVNKTLKGIEERYDVQISLTADLIRSVHEWKAEERRRNQMFALVVVWTVLSNLLVLSFMFGW